MECEDRRSDGSWRRSTASCCRSARFSSASARRDLRLNRAAASTANKSVLMVRGACAHPRKHQGPHAAPGFEDPQPGRGPFLDDSRRKRGVVPDIMLPYARLLAVVLSAALAAN